MPAAHWFRSTMAHPVTGFSDRSHNAGCLRRHRAKNKERRADKMWGEGQCSDPVLGNKGKYIVIKAEVVGQQEQKRPQE